MPTTDYSAPNVHELLNATLDIHADLHHRGLIRAGTPLAGELMVWSVRVAGTSQYGPSFQCSPIRCPPGHALKSG